MYTVQYLVNACVELDILGHVGEPVAHCVDVQGQVLTERGGMASILVNSFDYRRDD